MNNLNDQSSQTFEKSKDIWETIKTKTKKAAIIGLTALTLGGTMQSCNLPSGKCPMTEEKQKRENTPEQEDAAIREQIQKTKNILAKTENVLSKAYEEDFYSDALSGYYHHGNGQDGYRLNPIMIDGKKVVITTISAAGCYPHRLCVIVSDSEKIVTGHIRFFTQAFVGSQIGIKITVNKILVSPEETFSSRGFAKFENPKLLEYFNYINLYAEKAVQVAAIVVDKDLGEKHKKDQIVKHKNDSLQNIKIQESLQQQKLLDNEIQGMKQKSKQKSKQK